ncbi:NIPA-like protein [Rhynchospora pubera]|uniref:NIPA-like protein n=1 Tax=Rhynchospora pubera TaxID=906938 RepID=A0AAV8H9D1_9POAL|nr:NIPA-like protein [Rhynchospora pubera]
MREEVRSSGTAEPFALARSSSPPPTPVASSAGGSSPVRVANAVSIDWLGSSAQASKVGPPSSRPSMTTNAAGGSSALESSHPSCRPWERGDLLRRLATFKTSTWSSKPKVVNSLACSRRGWVNIDVDKIKCESCGAELMFTTSSSCSSAEVVDAGKLFVEQLDSGHVADCPWRGNSCVDSLVQFSFTASTLFGGYKDRSDCLLQFATLPIIASSAVETIRLTRSVQLDRLLSQPPNFLSGELEADPTQQDSSSGYAYAQKLISLCGWEPRWLPNVQDCEDNSTRMAAMLVKRDKGKGKMPMQESRSNSMRSPLLDCSLCGATVRILDFRTVSRPSRFGPNNIDNVDVSKKLTRGVSAASGINGWVSAEAERDQIEDWDEAVNTGEGRSLSNAEVDLSLTMAGGLPLTHSLPATSEHIGRGGMGRDLMIGQPTGSEVGDRAASYESRGPSSRKRNREEGGSTVDKPPLLIHQADSIEGTVIDRDGGDEVDDGTQDSGAPTKRSRGFDLFGSYRAPPRIDSSGAGPSRNFAFDTDINVNREMSEPPLPLGHARESTRASSVIAMDMVHSPENDSMESVENYPGGDVDDVHLPSPPIHRNNSLALNDMLDLNYSNQAQQSTCVQPGAGSVAMEVGGSSTNEGEEILNTETDNAYARDRDQVSLGISGGSVGMGASHEAEIHGADVSVHRTDSVVADAEPVAEVTENLGGHTGESVPGPGLMDEFVPEEVPQGDSQEQDMVSRSLGRADSGSKIYGSTKADSVESGEKFGSHAVVGPDSSVHPSLSCNAGIYSVLEVSKEEVTQTGNAYAGAEFVPENGVVGATNGENDYEQGIAEFDPIEHHKSYCPWVNGHVASASCQGDDGSISPSGSNPVPLCGWQLTLDAIDSFQSLGQTQNQTMQSESAASLYKDDHVTPSNKLMARKPASKSHGKH